MSTPPTDLADLLTHRVDIAGSGLSLLSTLMAVATLAAGFFLAARLAKRVRGSPAAAEHESQRWRGTAAKGVAYALRAASLLGALQVAGIPVGNIVAAGAVLAVGIGIAMQKVAENFISGIILMAERSIREGDVIEFDGRVAKVRHVGIRATIAVTLDDEEFIVPNSILVQSAVKNLTLTDATYRLRVKVGVAYGSDLAAVARTLGEAVLAIPGREPSRAPIVYLVDFASSSVDFEVCIWTRHVWDMRRQQSDMRHAIARALGALGVAIAFPQVDVHLDAEVVRAVAAGGRVT